MEVHAEYFLKCREAAKWLNTPQPVTGIPKEFLDGAHAVTTTFSSPCYRPPASSSTTCPPPPPPNHRPPPYPPPDDASPSHPSKSLHPVSSDHDDDPAIASLNRGFPNLCDMSSGQKPLLPKSLMLVPVELHDHFVFGVAVGCPFPPPDDVCQEEWIPLVNRFVLDAGRKCCLMFSYFAEGTVVVSLESFNDMGDRLSEVNVFERTAIVGAFPRGLRARMQILEKRDCPVCAFACVTCTCPLETRAAAIARDRFHSRSPGHGPAHAGASYVDENVTIQTYPYWAQVLDEYKWSRVGSYCVQVEYFDVACMQRGEPRTPTRKLAYRTKVAAESRATVDKMLKVSLYDKGVSALKPPATDVRWETSSTVSVNAANEVREESQPSNNVSFADWHKLPGFQQDYLLVAPSNIVSGAHARAELERAEAERVAARARNVAPVLPSWASGRAGVFEHIVEHILSTCEDVDEMWDAEYQESRDQLQSEMMRESLPEASVGTVMRLPRGKSDVRSPIRQEGSSRRSVEEGRPRITSVMDTNRRRRNIIEEETQWVPHSL